VGGEERFLALARELAIKEATLLNFIKSVNPNKADPSNIETTLRELVVEYHEQRERLRLFSTDDPAIDELKRNAREALDRGELAETEKLLNAASKLDLDAVARVEEIRLVRRRSAAALKQSIAQLKRARLQHAEAAAYYREAADLLPPRTKRPLRATCSIRRALSARTATFAARSKPQAVFWKFAKGLRDLTILTSPNV